MAYKKIIYQLVSHDKGKAMQTTLRTASSTTMKLENPMGTDGFEFVEFASTQPEQLITLFQEMGFTAIAKHRSKNVTLFRQGQINFVLNAESNSHAHQFAIEHGPCACAMAFRVKDAQYAFKRAVSLGATPFENHPVNENELAIPAIYGIGGSLLYFVDQYQNETIYENDFIPFENVPQNPKGNGLVLIDHLTHNVFRGDMDKWAEFYQKLFNFYEIRYFDINGEKTGLTSRALSSPCGKIKIPLNQSKDDLSQIEEYLREYKGEGIQHIALTTDNIYDSIEQLTKQGVKFLTVPETYYEMVNTRVPNHHEDLQRMKQNQIIIDGEVNHGKVELLLQIFTQNVIGPIFFEVIQRKGNDGFGEGNFKALFESIERDQMRRGVL